MKIIYSTPPDYIKAIVDEQQSYPPKTDDFFPYADHSNAYWTGYFTSRVAVKGFVRDLGRYIQAARKHISELKMKGISNVIINNQNKLENAIWGLETAMGILQHHDAVAGTEKQRVADDYVATGLREMSKFNEIYKEIKKEEIKREIGEDIADMNVNVFWNESAEITGVSKILSSNKTVLLNLYNPGPKDIYSIKVKVPHQELNINAPKVSNLEGDIFCPDQKDQDCELIFNLIMEESSNNYIKLVPSVDGSAKLKFFKQMGSSEPVKKIILTSSASFTIYSTMGKFDLTIDEEVETFAINYEYY